MVSKMSKLFLLLIFVLLMTFTVLSYHDTLVRHISMDDGDFSGATVYDLGPFGLNMTAVNTPTTGETCVINECFKFDPANTEYLMGTDTYINLAKTPRTMMGWFKHNDATGADYRAIVSLGQTAGGTAHIVYWHGNTSLQHNFFTPDYAITVDSMGTDWHHFAAMYDGVNAVFYLDGVVVDNQTTSTPNTGTQTNAFRIGRSTWDDGIAPFDGWIDEVCIFNTTLTGENITYNYNSGNGRADCALSGSPLASPSDPFQITAKELISDSSLTTFNASVDGTLYATTNGTINTHLLQNDTDTHNITVDADSHLPRLYRNLDVSSNLEAVLTELKLFSITYSNYNTTNSNNYVRNLTYSFNYTCADFSTTFLDRYINATLNNSYALTCDNSTQTETKYYQDSNEGTFNIYFKFNTTYGNSTQTATNTFITDLNDPYVTNLTIIFSEGFISPSANISMVCNDSIHPNIDYEMYFNGNLEFSGNYTANTTQLNSTTGLVNGDNILKGVCSDPFGSGDLNISRNVELRTLYIIDEQKNIGFDVQNLSSVIVYLDDNRTSYDFKTNSKNNISFIAETDVKLRFELIYSDATIILRYVDIGLLEEDVRVCANTEGVTHYEQILTSSSSRPVILNSVFADCVVAADYTRFAYQNSKVLKAYTYNNLYYLYTFENNDITEDQVFLASVDGSIATYINIDSLEFIEEGYNINTVGDTIAVNKKNSNEMEIYYYDVLQNNDALRVIIERVETEETLFNSTSFVDPNEGQILFNFNTLTPAVNDTSLFKVTSITTKDGIDETTTKYFNTNGVTGSLSSGMIAIISIIVLVFGLSFTIAQRTFAYFGIFVILANIAFLSTATAAWFITFLQAVNVILLIFTFLVLTGKNTVQIG